MNRFGRLTSTRWVPLLVATIFLSIFFLSLRIEVKAFTDSSPVPLPFHDTSVVPVPYRSGKALQRTFYVKKARQDQNGRKCREAISRILEMKHKRSLSRTQSSGIEVTYEDMSKAYAYGTDMLEFYAFPNDLTMDMGVLDPDLNIHQTWNMPAGLDFIQVTRKIVDPRTTQYSDWMPDATHCLYFPSSSDLTEVYQYYLLDEDGLYFVGRQVERFDYEDDDEYEICPLPLDVETNFQSGTGEAEDWTTDVDTTWYDDTTYGVEAWYYWSEAFGTLNTIDDGPVEVIKIAYSWIWSEWEVDEESEDGEDILVDEDNGTEIYFYSKDGHLLEISLDSLDAETTGLVKPFRIYYQKVQNQGNSVSETETVTAPQFSFFPNPSRGLVSFDSPTSYEVFDVLGRRVFAGENALRADLSGLARGMYFIRPHQGMARKLIIQK
jgi:hypothetical protein